MKKDTELKHLQVRMPEPLLSDLRQFAEEDARSINAEVVLILQQYANKRKGRRSDTQLSEL